MKIDVHQPWSYRGNTKTGAPFMIDYAVGMHNVPRHIAQAAIAAGVAHGHKSRGSSEVFEGDAGSASASSQGTQDGDPEVGE